MESTSCSCISCLVAEIPDPPIVKVAWKLRDLYLLALWNVHGIVERRLGIAPGSER